MEVLDMNNFIASGLTTDELFQRAPRLNKDDIPEHLSENDIQAVEEFEDAWKAFLESRPGILPPGRKVKNCRQIQVQMNEIEGKKQNVCLELQRQLDFFAESKGKLEEKYQKSKKDATIQQEGIIKQLEKNIDDIATADKLLSEVLPWEHFFENLEANTTTVYNGSVASMSAGSSQSQMLKPSGEAMYLANVQPGEVVYAARRGNSKAHLLRAYRIDNALLKAKAAMLRKEAERLERTIRSERMLSQILLDNDIWGIIADSRE
mmetsp:Transcript_5187/g.15109  ORF Transcript_5187/g.15109 Transcript_5187/m.15109 type:complete len:263 (+) Transcript_5187:132-920(+)